MTNINSLNIDFLENLDFSDIEKQVNELKTNLFQDAINNGQYISNPELIAEKMLEHALIPQALVQEELV